MILDEPTKGIDVGSKAAVHEFIGELAGEGLAVILVSSELPEVMGLADRVIVMHEGRIVGEFDARRRRVAEAIVARRDRRCGEAGREAWPARANARSLLAPMLIVALIVGDRAACAGVRTPGDLARHAQRHRHPVHDGAGQMVVILTRGIDLSVAANLALTGMLVGAGRRSTIRSCRSLVYHRCSPSLIGARCSALVNGGLIGCSRHPADRRDARHAGDLSRA